MHCRRGPLASVSYSANQSRKEAAQQSEEQPLVTHSVMRNFLKDLQEQKNNKNGSKIYSLKQAFHAPPATDCHRVHEKEGGRAFLWQR